MTYRIMSTRKLQITAAAALAGALFVGAAAPADHLAGPTHSARTVAINGTGAQDVELAASSSNSKPIFYDVVWDLDRGQAGYVTFIKQLRAQVILAASGHRREHPVGRNKQLAIDTLNNRASNRFTDIEVQTAGRSIHLVVRLSDLYVMGFHTRVDNPSDYHGFQYVYVPIAHDSPELNNALVTGNPNGSYTNLVDWQGNENYNDITRLGQTRLTDTTVGHASLIQAVRDMQNPHRRNQQQWMRGLLRMIMAVSEAARFRPLGTSVGLAFDHGGHKITNSDVALIRNWQGLSSVYHHYEGDEPGTSTRASIDIPGHGHIAALDAVIKLLQIAMDLTKKSS
ncbi:ribosome-inactivating family protein [Streptomyces guryensis]|uniref:Ribosome-inactivating family protein n=1 Tax=Streptomyces guryensis TaxID=2886947 RepID=A0A9Q3Z9H6_9ACTN|nr:ribosome-inactivating family protein [Streptomyces guryensis]MCD9879748.1 ribosome-inactivating family protein [Streptomyces guryensis]